MTRRSLAASEPVMFTSAARPDTVTTPLLSATRDHVVAVGAVDDDGVGLRRRRPPPARAEVEVDLR